jgi:hypothetical protein
MKKRKQISLDEAKRIGESLYIDWDQVDLEQFRRGVMENKRRTVGDPETGLTDDTIFLIGKLVLSHAEEFPDYFTRLEKLKTEVDEYRTRSR